MNRLHNPSCAQPTWVHLPWIERSAYPYQALMVAVCAECPALVACTANADEMVADGDGGVGFLAGRSQRERALEVSHARKLNAQLLSGSLASASKRG